MSAKKRCLRGRKRANLFRESNNDFPQSFLNLLNAQVPARKQSNRGRPCKRRATSTPSATPPAQKLGVVSLDDTPENVNMSSNAVASNSEVIDHSESKTMFESVSIKVGNFFHTGSFISSDEDEAEMIKAKTKKRPSSNPVFISDDSDDDKSVKPVPKTDILGPSTSRGHFQKDATENKLGGDNDFMVLLDTVISEASADIQGKKQNTIEDIKTLEDFRKETEEMLKNASCLLDELKTGRKTEDPKQKPEDQHEEDSLQVASRMCPICLEPLSGRPLSVTMCGHIFCTNCILETCRLLKKCPTCRKSITIKKIHPIYL